MAEKRSFKENMRSVGAFIKKLAQKVWAYLKVAKMEWLVMIGLLALDLISKQIIQATMHEWQSVTLIPKFLNIHYVYNTNAAFGADFLVKAFGKDGARALFSVFAIAASVVFAILLVRGKNGSKLYRVALAMLIAGALGNCVDRIFIGFVRDFIEFVYFGLTIFGRQSFYVFNFADAELVIGVVIFVIYFLFLYKDRHDEKKEAEKAAAAESASGDDNAQAADGASDANTDESGEPVDEATNTDGEADIAATDGDSGSADEAVVADGNGASDEVVTEDTASEERTDE